MRFEMIIYSAVLIVALLSSSVALAAGATSPASGGLAGKVLGNAWYRDGSIQVAVCNTSDLSQQVRVVIGVYDTSPRGFVQQRLDIKNGVVSQLTFPMVQRKSIRGDMETANFVFIYCGADPEELVASLPIQNKPTNQERPVLNQYMGWNGDIVTVSLAVTSEPHLRLVAVGKGIASSGPTLQGRLSAGSISPATAEDIRELDLPQRSKKQYLDRMEEEFVFVLRPGDSGWLAVDYEMPSINGCTIVTLPVYRTNIETGEGPISNVLIVLNKQDVIFLPALIMEPVSDTKGKSKTVR